MRGTDAADDDRTEANDLQVRMLQTCSILEQISKQFADESVEATAIREAAQAVTLIQQHRSLRNAYQKLLSASGGKLDAEMRTRLLRMGIDPDDLDAPDYPDELEADARD